MKRPAAPTRQVHVRVSPDLKKAVKMFCVRTGTTEQSWIHALIEDELRRQAPDLWTSSNEHQRIEKTQRH